MAEGAESDGSSEASVAAPSPALPGALPWPLPAPLEGVKSRRRVVFEVSAAAVAVGGEENRISRLKLDLFGRIAAVGEAGLAAVELLLGERQLASGELRRTDGLTVARLGPHLAGNLASVEEHEAQIAQALQGRPQVVVLEEARAAGNDAWRQTFDAILQCQAPLRSFRGAWVLGVAEETPAVRALCSERWVGSNGWLMQEGLSAELFEITEDVLAPDTPVSLTEELKKDLSELADESFGEENIVATAAEKGWSIAVLSVARPQHRRELRGFLCHRLLPHQRELCVYRLAVQPSRRGHGDGQRLVRWVIDRAARLPASECAWISLSALRKAIPFYERFGFCDMTSADPDDPENTQTWMELANTPRAPGSAQVGAALEGGTGTQGSG